MVTPLGLRADRRTPLVDARLPDGSRVHVAMPPLAVDGPYLTVRRFAARTLPVDDFAADPDVAALLVARCGPDANVVVVGGTGAGKTTLLNALCQHLEPGERVVTVEDAAELRLPGEPRRPPREPSRLADGLPARSPSASWSATRCACDPIASSSVRSGAARPSTCSRP